MTLDPTKVDADFNAFAEIVSETALASLQDLASHDGKALLVRITPRLADIYLSSFPEDIRQEYNCFICNAFLNGIGSLAVLGNDFKFVPLAFSRDLLDEVPEKMKHTYETLCNAFDNNLNQFDVLTEEWVENLEKGFLGRPFSRGWAHLGIDKKIMPEKTARNLLIQHAIDGWRRNPDADDRLANAYRKQLTHVSQDTLELLLKIDNLTESDRDVVKTWLEQVTRVQTLGVIDPTIIHAVYQEPDSAVAFLNSRVSRIGYYAQAHPTLEQVNEYYDLISDPTKIKNEFKPVDVPEFKELNQGLLESGYADYLPVRLAIFDEVRPLLAWEQDAEGNDFKVVDHQPVEPISLRGFEAELKKLIAEGKLKSITARGRQGYIGTFTSTMHEDGGKLYKTGQRTTPVFPAEPVEMKYNGPFFDIDPITGYRMDGIILDRDDHDEPFIILAKKNAKWKVGMPAPVFVNDLVDEVQPYADAIHVWASSTSINLDDKGNVIEYENVPLSYAVGIGSGIYVTTDTHSYQFEITSLR